MANLDWRIRALHGPRTRFGDEDPRSTPHSTKPYGTWPPASGCRQAARTVGLPSPSVLECLATSIGAEDRIRTRDPHLGKVVLSVRLGLARLLKWWSVHPVSTPSIVSGPVVERSATDLATIYESFEHLPVRTDLLQEWHEVGEEDAAGIGAGGVIVGVRALAIDQCEISWRNA